jgi:hypothetical protein
MSLRGEHPADQLAADARDFRLRARYAARALPCRKLPKYRSWCGRFSTTPQMALKQIRSEVCGTNYTTMKTSYPLKELEESHDKVIEVVTEATEKSIASCTRRLAAFKAP